MLDWEDYENCYEPSEVDELVNEFKDKCREFILPDIKEELERLNKENFELKTNNDDFRKRERQITIKENELKRKEDNLKQEVESDFYKTKVEDILARYMEESEVWFAYNMGLQQDKCSLCDDERNLIAEYPNGEKAIKRCKCNELTFSYVPQLAIIENIKFSKNNTKYRSDQKYYLSRVYQPTSSAYGDSFEYREFGIQYVVEEFTEDTIELRENLGYGKKIGFTTKEQCQLYCDWLNKKENNNKETRSIPKLTTNVKK